MAYQAKSEKDDDIMRFTNETFKAALRGLPQTSSRQKAY